MTTSDTYAMMDQLASGTVNDTVDASAELAGVAKVQSGLAHVGLPAHDNTSAHDTTVVLCERPVTGLLLLRSSLESTALSNALKTICGVGLSARLQSESHEDYCIRWMSPDCWLLSCPLDKVYTIETDLRAAISGHIAVVNVSGGYTILELSGVNARRVLMKSTGYDTHPNHFAAGKVVNTTFSKAQITLRAIEADDNEDRYRYELIIRRSFSDYVWLWLQRAASEYGLGAFTMTN